MTPNNYQMTSNDYEMTSNDYEMTPNYHQMTQNNYHQMTAAGRCEFGSRPPLAHFVVEQSAALAIPTFLLILVTHHSRIQDSIIFKIHFYSSFTCIQDSLLQLKFHWIHWKVVRWFFSHCPQSFPARLPAPGCQGPSFATRKGDHHDYHVITINH